MPRASCRCIHTLVSEGNSLTAAVSVSSTWSGMHQLIGSHSDSQVTGTPASCHRRASRRSIVMRSGRVRLPLKFDPQAAPRPIPPPVTEFATADRTISGHLAISASCVVLEFRRMNVSHRWHMRLGGAGHCSRGGMCSAARCRPRSFSTTAR